MARKIISNQCKCYLLTREHGIQSSLRRQLPGEGNGTPLQYSCLENSMDRGAWQAADHGVAKSGTWLSNWHGEDSWAVGGSEGNGAVVWDGQGVIRTVQTDTLIRDFVFILKATEKHWRRLSREVVWSKFPLEKVALG